MSFPQKVIASGMSLVLAFGLSPLGQVPAYADEGLQTQAASLQAQQRSYQFGGFYVQKGEEVNPSLEYTGVSQDISVTITDTDGTKVGLSPTVEADSENGIEASDGKPLATASLVRPGEADKDAVSVAMTDEGTFDFAVKESGTYKLTVKGTAQDAEEAGKSYAAATPKTFEIKVAQLDLSTLESGDITVNQGAPLVYTGKDIPVTVAVSDLTEGKDFRADTTSVHKRGYNTVRITALGDDCTGYKEFDVDVARTVVEAGFATPDADSYMTLNGQPLVPKATTALNAATWLTKAADAAVTDSNDMLVVSVPVNKASDPLEIKFGDDTLSEDSDFTVDYYQDAAHTASKKYTNKSQLPKAVNDDSTADYYGVITFEESRSFDVSSGKYSKVYVAFKVDKTGEVEKIADSAQVAAGKYLGGKAVLVDPEKGGTFKKGAQDVSTVIGKAFSVIATATNHCYEYGILSTNTAATAQLATDGSNVYPVGAGDYYVRLTGDGKSYKKNEKTNLSDEDGLLATFHVDKADAFEGEEVGELEIKVADVAYEDGAYVTPAVSVKMYTEKGQDPEDVDPVIYAKLVNYDADGDGEVGGSETSSSGFMPMGVDVTNWKVRYLDASGSEVVMPAEMGDYTAVIDFGGNFNAKSIEKKFKVGTGDIAGKVDGLKMYKANATRATGDNAPASADLQDITLVYTGEGREFDPDDVVLMKDNAALTAAAQEELLDGTEFSLSYASRGASVDPTSKLPVGVGSYTVTASFTGKNSGDVSDVLKVTALKAGYRTGNNAEIQYLQDDEITYDTEFSTVPAEDKSAIEPTIRIAVIDGKEKSDEPTLLSQDAYKAVFTENEAAGTAKLKLTANAAYRDNVDFDAQANPAFEIRGTSFKSIGAGFDMSKTKFAYNYGSDVSGIKFTVTHSGGNLSYGYAKTTADGYVIGVDSSDSENTEIYKNANKYYKVGTTTPEVSVSGTFTPTVIYDYDLRVLDEDGALVTEATFSTSNNTADATKDDASTWTKDGAMEVTVKGIKLAGKYTIVAGAGENGAYAGRFTKEFEVTPLDISNSEKFAITWTNAKGEKVPLSGEWSTPFDAGKAGTKAGITLDVANDITIQGASSPTPLLPTDFDVEYKDNKKAGKATIVFKGKGNYTGTVEQPYTITKGVFSKAEFSYDSDGNRTACTDTGYFVDFDKAAFDTFSKDLGTVAFASKKFEPDYVVNYYMDAADAQAAGLGAGYDTTKPVSYLVKGQVEADFYNNENVYYAPNSTEASAGAQLVVKASDDYEGTVIGWFKIAPIDLSNNDKVNVEVADQAYTGTAIAPTAKITYNGVELKEGTDYTISGDGSAEVGEHRATILDVFGGNYTISEGAIYKTYQIKNVDLTGAAVKLSATSFTYNGKAQAPVVETVTLKDGTVLAGDTLNASIPASVNAGPYEVTVTGKTAGVTGQATAGYAIAKAANTLTVKAKKPSVKASKLKAKKRTIKAAKAFSVTKNASGGKVTYQKTSGSKKVNVASNGKVTVKKGTKKGTYTVKVKATSKETANYAAKTTAAFKLKVKVK